MSANQEDLDREEMAARIRERSVERGELPSDGDMSGGEPRGLDREEQAARVREGSTNVEDLPSEPPPETEPEPEEPTQSDRQQQPDTTAPTSEQSTQGGADGAGGEDVPVVETEQEAREVVEEQLEAQRAQDLQAGEDFTVERTDQGFQAQFTEGFRREVAEARLEERLEERTGRDIEPGRDFEVVRTPDDRFRADLQPQGRRRSGAAARRSDASLLVSPSMVEQGVEFERLSRREIGAARRREDPETLTPESQVEQGFEFERVSGREIGAARRREDPEALTPESQVEQGFEFERVSGREIGAARRREDPEALTSESMVEQGVEFEKQATEQPQRGLDRVASALNISTTKAQELAERGELQDRIDEAGLRESATGVDISDRASNAVVDFQDSLDRSERGARDAALTRPQKRIRNLLSGGGGESKEDFSGPQGEIESQLESQTGVDLGRMDIEFQTEVRDGERVLTGGLTREGARTVAVETAPFQGSAVEPISEAAARVEVETDLIASDVRETIRQETGVDALFKGELPDVDLQDVGSGIVSAGAVGVATPEPVTSAAGVAGAAVGTGIVGAGVVLQGEPPKARAETELPLQQPVQDQSEIETPEEPQPVEREVRVPEERQRIQPSELGIPEDATSTESEIPVDVTGGRVSGDGDIEIPEDADGLVIRAAEAQAKTKEEEEEEEEDEEDEEDGEEEEERVVVEVPSEFIPEEEVVLGGEVREGAEEAAETTTETVEVEDEGDTEEVVRRQFGGVSDAERTPEEDTAGEGASPDSGQIESDLELDRAEVTKPTGSLSFPGAGVGSQSELLLAAFDDQDQRVSTAVRPSVDIDEAVGADSEMTTAASELPRPVSDAGLRDRLDADVGQLSGVRARQLSRAAQTEGVGTLQGTDVAQATEAVTATQQSTVEDTQFDIRVASEFTATDPVEVDIPTQTGTRNDPGFGTPFVPSRTPRRPRARPDLDIQIEDKSDREERFDFDLFARRTEVRPGDPDEAITDLNGNTGGLNSGLEDL